MKPMLDRLALPAVVLTALALAGPCRGQSSHDGEQDQRAPSPSPRSERIIQGTIQRVRAVPVRGADYRAMLVTLRCRDGQQMLVDLGPTTGLRDVDLRTGDRISARGRVFQRGNLDVLLASRAWVDGEAVAIHRPARRPGEEQSETEQGHGHAMRRYPRAVTGIVESTHLRKLRDSDVQNLVVQVKSPKGRVIVIDLGPASDLRDLKIQKGDRITARGFDARINDRTVLIAYRLTADGETVGIDREGQVRPARNGRH